MKRFFLVFVIMLAVKFSMAAVTSPLPGNELVSADRIYITVNSKGQKISLLELSTIKPKVFSELTGRKMNLIERIAFSLLQKKLRKKINSDNSINLEKVKKKSWSSFWDSETGFNANGFLEGFALGLIGVLIIYLISIDVDETLRRNRIKWAWIGFGSFALLVLAAFLIFA